MKISKKSWHYRLNKSMSSFNDMPYSNCDYVFETIKNISLVVLFTLSSLIAFYFLGREISNQYFPTIDNHVLYFIVGLGEVILILVLVVFSVTLFDFLVRTVRIKLDRSKKCNDIEYTDE